MSVINETLDNLKQNKKRPSGSLNPSSSAYCEKVVKSEKASVSSKSYIIPASFALLVGLLFYISQLFMPAKDPQNTKKESGWFEKSTSQAKQQSKKQPAETFVANPVAQEMYYNAMNLLNQGNEEQALHSLQEIIAQYPDFSPAQKAYSMLAIH